MTMYLQEEGTEGKGRVVKPGVTPGTTSATGPSRQRLVNAVPSGGPREPTTSAVHVEGATSTAAQGSADSEGGGVSVPRPDDDRSLTSSSAPASYPEEGPIPDDPAYDPMKEA